MSSLPDEFYTSSEQEIRDILNERSKEELIESLLTIIIALKEFKQASGENK